jgi:hypothetical protein
MPAMVNGVASIWFALVCIASSPASITITAWEMVMIYSGQEVANIRHSLGIPDPVGWLLSAGGGEAPSPDPPPRRKRRWG